MTLWRIEFGNYGQGYTMRVCRELADGSLDVWGYYTDAETAAAHSALERAKVDEP